MRILHFVGFHPDIGGPFSVVKGLLKSLNKLGIISSVCSIVPEEFDTKKINNVPYINEVVQLKSIPVISEMWPSYTSEIKKLSEKLKKYDVIHVYGIFDYCAYFTCKYLHKPYIISPHGTLIEEVLRHSFLRKKIYLYLWGKKILKGARFIHVLTNHEKEALIKIGIEEKFLKVVPNGIDPDEFNYLPTKDSLFARYPYLKDKKIALFLSRINWKKGLDDLIPAFADVVKEINDAFLIIAGPDTDNYMQDVKNWIERYNLSDKISYVGPVYGKDKLMFLQDSDIFVLPSYSEGFPMSVIEAMYMKLPVVVTENIGIPDEVRNSRCGIVVNKNRKEITDAIIYLLKNNALSIEMGLRGRKCVGENFLWDKIAGQMLEVYEKALCVR